VKNNFQQIKFISFYFKIVTQTPPTQATIINHYYDKILINQTTGTATTSSSITSVAATMAAAASAAVSAAVTANSIQKQQQNLNDLNSSPNKSIVNISSSSEIIKDQIKPIPHKSSTLNNSNNSNSAVQITSTQHQSQNQQQQQLQQHTISATNSIQPLVGQYVAPNTYSLNSSTNTSNNMNASGNTSTIANISASPSSSVSSYLSMPSLSNNSFGFNQQQTFGPNHQIFQNFYQPQSIQNFGGNQQQAKNPNNFDDFSHQQQVLLLLLF